MQVIVQVPYETGSGEPYDDAAPLEVRSEQDGEHVTLRFHLDGSTWDFIVLANDLLNAVEIVGG